MHMKLKLADDEESSLCKFLSPKDYKQQNLNIHQNQALRNGNDVEPDSWRVKDDSSDTPNKCFPCVTSISSDKRRSSTPSPTNKAVSGHPYKTTDGQSNAALGKYLRINHVFSLATDLCWVQAL